MSPADDPTETETGGLGHEEPLVTPAGESRAASLPVQSGAGTPATSGEAGAIEPAAEPVTEPESRLDSHNMLPGRERRRTGVERFFVRLVATAGIVGIGVAIAAIMVSSKSQGWLVGLVVSIVSVVLAAVLWSSRQL